jgi:cytidylate kinase
MRIYAIDNDDYTKADLVIDTGSLTPEEIAERIIASAMEKNPA